MSNEVTPVTLDEFSSKLQQFFDRVVHEHEEVLIENSEGEIAVLKSAPRKRRSRKRVITEEDRQAFLSSAGGWSDVDVDAFKEYIRESRQISTRPEIEL